MRFRLLLGSFAAAAVLCSAPLPAACSSDDTITIPPGSEAGASSGSSGSSTNSSGSSGSSGDAEDAAPDTSKVPTSTDCSLMPIAAIPDVTPTFVVYHTPDVIPPTQTGGTLSGTYTVDKATVYLPAAIALVSGGAAPTGTGTINSWAVFKGTRYLLHTKVDLNVTAGTQALPITNNVDSQGGFATAAEKLTLDYSCDTTQPDQADYSYTDDGSGRATILVHTVTNYDGFMLDGYLLLEAAKTP